MTETERRISHPDKKHFFRVRYWLPEGEPRAIVQIVHGISEHIDRYERFASYLSERGYLVIGDDHLGHGKSVIHPDDLGWIAEKDGWKLLGDAEIHLASLLKHAKPDLPIILLGHSMGSFIARTIIGWRSDLFDACILSGTGHQPIIVCKTGQLIANAHIRKNGSKSKSELLQNLSFGSYLKKIENPKTSSDWISRDEKIIASYQMDPLSGFEASASLMRDMLQGLELIARSGHIRQMDKSLPVLFIAGTHDPVGNYGKGVLKVKSLFEKAGVKNLSVILYPEMRHEVLNEIGYEQVFEDVLAWMEKLQIF